MKHNIFVNSSKLINFFRFLNNYFAVLITLVQSFIPIFNLCVLFLHSFKFATLLFIVYDVMRWAGHVARMGEERGCIGSWWGNRKERATGET